MRYGIRITDFHSHVLPGADHGSDSVETSERQLELLNGAGIDRVVATPHFYPSDVTVGEFLDLRERCAEALMTVIHPGMPEVILGAEVLVCRGLEEMEGLERLSVEGTNVILLEMPLGEWDESLIETVGLIKRRGLTPLMAHIERYEGNPIGRLFELGIGCQINARSIVSRRRRSRLLDLIGEGKVVALGSDIHGADKSCARDFMKACGLLKDDLEPLMAETDVLLAGAKVI